MAYGRGKDVEKSSQGPQMKVLSQHLLGATKGIHLKVSVKIVGPFALNSEYPECEALIHTP